MRKKPHLMIATPEMIFDFEALGLEAGTANFGGKSINFSMGGLAPVPSTYMRALIREGTFRLSAAIPKWESSLREFNDMNTLEIKNIQNLLPNNVHLISNPSFNKVLIQGSNTRMYDDSWRFSSIDRAIAFSAGVANAILEHEKPDILWVHDWMLGPVAPVAKALGIKLVTTCHNPIFTQYAHIDELIYKGIELRDFDNYRPSERIYKAKDPRDNQEKFDFMASGINSADDFTTVSEGVLERMLNCSFDDRAPSVMHAVKEKAKPEHNHRDGRSRVHGYLNPLEKDESEFLNMIKKDGLENTIQYRKKKAVEIRQKTGLKEGGNLVLYANRLYDQKKPELIIENAIQLAYKHNLRILINANGDPYHVRRAIEVSLASNGYVAYTPFSKELENEVKRSDKSCGAMTSEFEPCGGPNINYPAEGIPVIGHAVDGIKDTIHLIDVAKSRGNGVPYNDNNIQGFEWAIVQMNEFLNLDDKIKYSQQIRMAKEALQNHSSSRRASQLVNDLFLPLYLENNSKPNLGIKYYLSSLLNFRK